MLEEIENNVKAEMAGAAHQEIVSRIKAQTENLQNQAARVFTGELNEYIENVRKAHEQRIDLSNPDQVIQVGWDKDNIKAANEIIASFAT